MLLFCCRFFIIATVIAKNCAEIVRRKPDENGIVRFDKHTEMIAPK